MRLTPQQKQLLKLLMDGQWHCSTEIEFMRDARKRLSEIRALGYYIKGEKCNKHPHKSALHMLRWERKEPVKYVFDEITRTMKVI